uniref:CSC1/OSCA1-like 7TM region domain-containing protein n=1 Tax=Salix viminalis TaxID=40686 RepID=A0A6N2JYB7_SALVM
MATLQDIGVSALINVLGAFAFLLAFALLRVQPINDRVYFPKWYISGGRSSPRRAGNSVGKLVNLDIKTSFTFLNWMPQALKMSEAEIINHAGLDSAVFLRIYTLGLKIFVPITILALVILIPVNVSSGTLFFLRKELVMSNIDKLSISNEYDHVASMRLHFLASQRRHAEQFTVVVRNVPHVSGRSVLDTAEQFFKKNHPNTYLCQQAVYNANKFAKLVRKRDRLQNWLDYNQLKSERHPDKRPTRKKGFLGIWGERVDSIEYYKQQIKLLEKNVSREWHRSQAKVLKDSKSILPVSFVSFNSRWGAAVCAQTQQSKNPTLWLTNWAPEPRDIYWRNLAIPFVSLTVRKLIISLSVFALVFFYMIPIAFVQSLANLEGLERVAPFLRPVIELKFIKSFLQGFLPGLALKIFLYILPTVLMVMSKVEGYIAHSALERRAAAKYYYFMLVNVFLGSIIAGTAFEQLDAFLHQSPTQIPRTIGVSIPMKATFFITYIMVDGWAGIAGEILRLKPLIIFHLKNMFLVKTERDREKAMNPGSVGFPKTLPRLQLYFLLGIVYAVVTPILLPFILVFFAFAYLVYRHQIVNVYNQQYESAAAFWPHVHSRIIAIILPILTLSFHNYCKSRFEPAFRKYPLEASFEAMEKDILDRTTESDINLKAYLADAYLHPIFHSFEEEELVEVNVERNKSHTASDPTTEISSSSPPHQVSHPRSPPHYVYHPSSPPQHAYHPHSPPHYAYHYENEP